MTAADKYALEKYPLETSMARQAYTDGYNKALEDVEMELRRRIELAEKLISINSSELSRTILDTCRGDFGSLETFIKELQNQSL